VIMSRETAAEAAVGPQLAQQALEELPLLLHQVWLVSLAGHWQSCEAAAEAAVGPHLAQQALQELPLLLHQVQTFLMWLLCPLRGVLNLNLHGPTAWL